MQCYAEFQCRRLEFLLPTHPGQPPDTSLPALSARASSISLVNMPLVPTLANDTSRILSPVVLMISISTAWLFSRSNAATWLACQSASLEPREPMRKLAIFKLPTLRFGLSVGVGIQIEYASHHVMNGLRFRMCR